MSVVDEAAQEDVWIEMTSNPWRTHSMTDELAARKRHWEQPQARRVYAPQSR
ncbi:hypothetical protein BV22DRAFT_1037216 [Leucogyrophana mollusca]|uniref:Uncharacterized protein n=1 Tax=Leucogyrophana mollusca TaxID=85980 RepID=A0ACB8BCI1_9AGAM|nr:hypothetical protein BV22DRAFT_1037216 [Leucogyrophana mollusca]